ncbi:HNH endonuclease family protein [Clostridium argentinense CDC 2741]|uniref:HNH endonuclease family protein n=1 Tax=Clostridium argentinense CDC 2741 TaxID=1418104 RepID=A0A0C1QUJ4_9CLOT|nr:RNA-guided endonuclease IscB [Clostridium argentinense]ARC84116.1 HNH endonuclease [Clostridium argentinense]KIE44717.1 HNH endonuclease family protein [Clostridium argentinense CDC 2741]NFF39279.1 HNH endonuclease [Clostridium argentinense]NFP51478.1 HNH endonuclease [Clostridium argentinense]NFP74335.1 HNH endonuclease [Clostridium argentinense]
MTKNQKEYSFVKDQKGRKLASCLCNKAWVLIRKKKARLLQKYPMAIQLNYEVCPDEETEIICGIDDGSKHVGIALVQKCKTYNKPIFKGTIELRQNVKSLMETRKSYRRYHRTYKRYRKVRFDNRSASKRKGRVAPSILQKKQSTIRIINQLLKFVNIKEFHLEDVVVDIRALSEGKKLYGWQYQKSNRLDENIRKAVILRDNCECMECGKSNCMLEVHHIVPRRLKGSNAISNLITLCSGCHQKTEGKEELFIDKYYKTIDGKNIRFDYAQHVMQGKTYLRQELSKLGKLMLTTGGDTANKRIDWNIYKTHSNDAICITDLEVNMNECNIKDWIIKPMRRKSKANIAELNGFKHRDLIKYTKKNGEYYIGYITALYSNKNQCNITTMENKILKRYGIKSCKLLWRFNIIYWF